jgi:hypothetical protein
MASNQKTGSLLRHGLGLVVGAVLAVLVVPVAGQRWLTFVLGLALIAFAAALDTGSKPYRRSLWLAFSCGYIAMGLTLALL